MQDTSFRWTIPNVLSLYRLASFPVVFYLALKNYEQAFVAMLVINLITDILDGLIARVFNQRTLFGAKLDSAADIGTYILALTGLLQFQMHVVEKHWLSLSIFFVLYIFGFVISFVKFKRIVGLHLYSFKITGYVQGFFFFVLFTYGYIDWFYYLMITVGIFADIEDIIVLLVMKKPRSDVKGLYWVLQHKETEA